MARTVPIPACCCIVQLLAWKGGGSKAGGERKGWREAGHRAAFKAEEEKEGMLSLLCSSCSLLHESCWISGNVNTSATSCWVPWLARSPLARWVMCFLFHPTPSLLYFSQLDEPKGHGLQVKVNLQQWFRLCFHLWGELVWFLPWEKENGHCRVSNGSLCMLKDMFSFTFYQILLR